MMFHKIRIFLNNKNIQFDKHNDFILQNDGNGPYIKHWAAKLGPEPTQSELNTITNIEVDDFLSKETIDNEFDKDKIKKLMFNINLDQENRIRTLEGKMAISRSQYKNALLSKLKTL